MSQTADLHFHTTNSDGSHTVEWVARQLKMRHAQGLTLAVLTDHDGFSGYEEFEAATREWQRPICASELSCTFSDRGISKELHLLVYGLDPHEREMHQFVGTFKKERESRFYKMCEKLNQAGYPIQATNVAAKHTGVLGRPHVADALVEMGVARDRPDAFARFLGEGAPYYVEKWRFPIEEAVRYAKKFNCKTSVAHPGQYGFKEELLKLWRDLGVDAIEVVHPRHTPQDQVYYREVAARLGFAISGGSDFHSEQFDLIQGQPSLGSAPYEFSEAKKFLGDLI